MFCFVWVYGMRRNLWKLMCNIQTCNTDQKTAHQKTKTKFQGLELYLQSFWDWLHHFMLKIQCAQRCVLTPEGSNGYEKPKQNRIKQKQETKNKQEKKENSHQRHTEYFIIKNKKTNIHLRLSKINTHLNHAKVLIDFNTYHILSIWLWDTSPKVILQFPSTCLPFMMSCF